MKNKGFTLIELLAVIVILAVIALITLPIVTNTINKSSKKSMLSSAANYKKGIEQAIMNENLNGNFEPTSCGINSRGNLINCDVDESREIKINSDGMKPISGEITISELKVVSFTITFDSDTVRYENGIYSLISQE